MVSLGGGRQLNGSMPYHRLQANALLEGHFSLADSIYQIDEGLAWYDGKVQQVWGLGVGLWLTPLEALSHWIGGEAFVGRVALGAAFVLLAFYCGSTAVKLAGCCRKPGAAVAVLWLILLCPALWTLARGRQSVFEETVLYAVVISLAILLAVIRVCCFASCLDLYLCSLLGAFVGFVRPTHAVYGVAGVLVCSLALLLRRRALGHVIGACLILAAGLTGLAWTNEVRFGSPWEFGHTLTVNSGAMVFLTRFHNPMEQVAAIDGISELFGLLFLGTQLPGGDVFASGLFPGQSSAVRWRGLNMSAFDISVPLMCVVAIGGALVWLWRRHGRHQCHRPTVLLTAGLVCWLLLTASVLARFYLRYPAIASRYLMDFAPALLAGLLLFWLGFMHRFPKVAIGTLSVWLLFEIGSAQVIRSGEPQGPAFEGRELPAAEGRRLPAFQGSYSIGQHPQYSEIAYNGYGWDDVTGYAGPIVMVAVDKPEFLELTVGERRGDPRDGSDVYRARIGHSELVLERVVKEDQGNRVIFRVPRAIQQRGGDELVFLCFVDGNDLDERNSTRMLRSIKWR